MIRLELVEDGRVTRTYAYGGQTPPWEWDGVRLQGVRFEGDQEVAVYAHSDEDEVAS